MIVSLEGAILMDDTRTAAIVEKIVTGLREIIRHATA
jgi:hypothetical protein